MIRGGRHDASIVHISVGTLGQTLTLCTVTVTVAVATWNGPRRRLACDGEPGPGMGTTFRSGTLAVLGISRTLCRRHTGRCRAV